MKDQQILIRLSKEEKEKAMLYAKALGLSLSGFIRLLINTYDVPEKPAPRKKGKKILTWR
jgi:antitoxin component of RelBE/YafQ-DinJ toxin-antitoxin module